MRIPELLSSLNSENEFEFCELPMVTVVSPFEANEFVLETVLEIVLEIVLELLGRLVTFKLPNKKILA